MKGSEGSPPNQRSRNRSAGASAKSRSRRRAWICALTMIAAGCVSIEAPDIDGFVLIPMNRVVPFPSEEERSDRAFEIAIVNGESGEIDESLLDEPRIRVAQELRKIATSAGARVITRSGALVGELESVTDPELAVDYDLMVHFEKYQDVATWKPPFKFLWQSPEEVAGEPGTCTHRAEVGLEIEVVEPSRDGRTREIYSLRHSAELKIDELDQSCPLDPEPREALFSTALLEALGCLKAPLDRLLAPRGHVMAHRRARDSESEVFAISMGTSQGIAPGDLIEVRREQHASTPAGEAWRTERVIAEGVVTDRVRAETAWVAIDVDLATEEILEGDVVRPVVSQGLLSSLSGPNCKGILEIR